jgi:hypothetical protein
VRIATNTAHGIDDANSTVIAPEGPRSTQPKPVQKASKLVPGVIRPSAKHNVNWASVSQRRFSTSSRCSVAARFAAYSRFDTRVSTWRSDWLRSEAGSVWWTSKINGAKVSVVGVNTAWLCQDDDDWGRLTPGRYMLERGLDQALRHAPDLLIVLGHHPLRRWALRARQPTVPVSLRDLSRRRRCICTGIFILLATTG